MDIPFSQQALQQKKLKKVAKYSMMAIALILSFFAIASSFTNSINRADIRTAHVIKQDLKISLSAGGIIVPVFEETIASSIESHLIKVLVQAGQTVTVGQTLMQLDTNKVQLELENMDEKISLQENKIKTRKLELNKNLNAFKGRLELLAVDLDSRKTRFYRLDQLKNIGGASAHDLKEAELNVKRTQIEIRQLEQTIKDSEASTVAEIEGFKLEQSILEKSRHEKLRLFESATVTASRNGLVSWVNNEEGSAISKGEALIKIADTSSFKIEATISDFYSNQLWQGMATEFDYNEKQYSGKLQSIIAGEQEGLLSLTITIDSLTKSQLTELRQKQRVDVSLITKEQKDALVIEKGPFINGSGIQKVFVINQQEALRTQVTIASGNRNHYLVKQGLSAGDEIIISDITSIANLNQIEIN